jgi:hypothetical protein
MDNFPQLILPWLLVLVFIIHDGEEAIFLPRWVQNNSSLFDAMEMRFSFIRKPLRLLRENNQQQFVISVLFLLFVITLFTGLVVFFSDIIFFQYLFIGITAVFTLHLLVHIFQSVFLRRIVPGTITSILVFPPSLYLWLHQIQAAHLTFLQSLLVVLASVLLFLPVFIFALRFGNWTGRKTSKSSTS